MLACQCLVLLKLAHFDVDLSWLFKVLDIPLTVKMRTGISDKKTSWNAHKLISNLKLWDVSLVTVSQCADSYTFVYSNAIFLESLLFSVVLIGKKNILLFS